MDTPLHPAGIDLAVLMLFFNRPQTLRLVFDQVRKARPSRLFLYQDGPRGPRDLPAMEECRRIVAQIDWECQVERHYCSHNQGCDPSGYLSHRWAFEMADKVMVLEDDVVPSQSFFPFCKEMLDRYEHDPRIAMVAGFNIDERTPDAGDADYFFTSAFSIWGWASWRRVVQAWDGNYSFTRHPSTMRQLEQLARHRRLRANFIPMLRQHAQSGKPYFESIFWSAMLMSNALAVMPAVNMVNNVGAMAESTHFASSLATMPHRLRRIFTMPRHEVAFPLRHPAHVMELTTYAERLYLVNAWNHPLRKVAYSVEELLLNLRHLRFAAISKALARRIRKWVGKERHR